MKIAISYLQEPVFENEIPISHEPNHGLGTKSMISVVEKYHGVYGFFAEDGKFRPILHFLHLWLISCYNGDLRISCCFKYSSCISQCHFTYKGLFWKK